MAGSKWQQHIEAVQLIRQHYDWSDERVMEALGLKPLEVNIVQEARREVDNERLGSSVRSERSY